MIDERSEYLGSFKTTTGGYVSIIDYYDEDEEQNAYCLHCWDFGFEVKLGPRLLKKDEPIPPDHDQFKQCPECGTIVPIYEVKHESKIQPFAEPVSNPFELGTEILGIDNRATQRKKGKKRKGRFSYFQQHEDPEIQREIDRHGSDNVRIIQ